MQYKSHQFEFKPTLIGTLFTLICIPLFIKLGLWQYNKAQLKQKVQDAYVNSMKSGDLELDKFLEHPEFLEYQKVRVSGQYESQYQILIDNQVEQGQAGYHVITPFKIKNNNQYVLVNRGWISANAIHADVPKVDTPANEQVVEGMIWLPAKKIFTLESKAMLPSSKQWQTVWQNLDLKKYQELVQVTVLPVVIKLDAKSNAGGYVRNWQVSQERIMTHMSYAYQWFGFTVSAVLIYLYMSFKRVNKEQI